MAAQARVYARLAWWVFRSNPKRLVVPLVTLAAGIACMMTASSITSRLAARGTETANQWIAADLMVMRGGEGALERLRAAGLRATAVREWNTRAQAGERSRLVAVKTVDPAEYPYYGELRLEGGGAARAVLERGEALASREFVEALGREAVVEGETIRVGGVLAMEPDRWAGPNVAGLRMMRRAVAGERLRVGGAERILVRGSGVREQVEALLPEALVQDASSATARGSEALEWVVATLWVMRGMGMGFALLAMVAVVQMQLLEHEQALRVLRVLGARPRTVERAFLLAMAAVATPGVLVGAAVSPMMARVAERWVEGVVGLLPAGEGFAWKEVLGAWVVVMASASWAARQPRVRPVRRPWGYRWFAETRLRWVMGVALGAAVAVVSATYLLRAELAGEFLRHSPGGEPNLLVLKVTAAERSGMEALLPQAKLLPFVRLASRNGKPGLWLVTCREGMGAGVLVEQRVLRRMGLREGEELRLGLENGELRERIREERGLTPLRRFWEGVVVDCGKFPQQEAFWNGGAWVEPEQMAAVEERIAALAPGVVTVRSREFALMVDEGGEQAQQVLNVAAGQALLVALLLMGLLVRLASERRQREIAILRALGARRVVIVKRLARELAWDAAWASGGGLVLGVGVAQGVLRGLTGDWPGMPPVGVCVGIWLGATLLAVGTGLWMCRRFWRVKPMEILRRV